MRSRKRGLTVSAPSPDDLKKAKVEPSSQPEPKEPESKSPDETTQVDPSEKKQPEAASMAETSIPPIGDSDVDDDDDEKSVYAEELDKGRKKQRICRLPGDGPHTFITYADAMISIFSGEIESPPYMVRKSTLLKVAAHEDQCSACDDDEDCERTSLLLDRSGFWIVNTQITQKKGRTKEADALCDVWDKLCEGSPKGQWWYEVTVQREKPKEGVPALEIQYEMFLDKVAPDSQGSWWITGFAVPDEESQKAAEILEENIPQYFLV